MSRIGLWCAVSRRSNLRLACRLRRRLLLQPLHQFLNKGALSRQNFSASGGETEIGDAVNLGKILIFVRVRRPFHFEHIAGEGAKIKIGLERKSMYRLPTLLA